MNWFKTASLGQDDKAIRWQKLPSEYREWADRCFGIDKDTGRVKPLKTKKRKGTGECSHFLERKFGFEIEADLENGQAFLVRD